MMITKHRIQAFLGTALFLLTGSFFSQNMVQSMAGPYGSALPSGLFVSDAHAAYQCGECKNNNCETGSAYSGSFYECDMINGDCKQRDNEQCSG